MSAPLAISLNLQLKGVHSSVRLASLIVLGLELDHLKRKLGYVGMGSWQAYRSQAQSGDRPRWPGFCKAEAGISDRAAQIYLECGEALKNRLRPAKFTGAKHLLGQMAKVPSELTAAQRTALIGEIARMIPDSSQTLLRAEFQAAKLTPEELKEVRNDPSAAARLDQKRTARATGVLMEEFRRKDPQALARLAMRALSQMKADGKLHTLLGQ
jgi:hypothetical protein